MNVSKCGKCGHIQYHNNSCRDRACPMCQALSNEMWVDAQNENVLDIVADSGVILHVSFPAKSQ